MMEITDNCGMWPKFCSIVVRKDGGSRVDSFNSNASGFWKWLVASA